MRNLIDLNERVIIVTGAGQGIGAAISKMAASLGAKVVAVDTNKTTVNEVVEQLAVPGMACVGSVVDPIFVRKTVFDAVSRYGRVDGLVNNAGIIRPAMIEKMALEQWQEVLDVHLTGSFLFCRPLASTLSRRNAAGQVDGSIVNTSSVAGQRGSIGQMNYSTAKAGMLGMTMSATREWAKFGIRTNTLLFGVVETPMTEVIRSERFRDNTLAQIPMGRWAMPEEAASAACFLLSSAASYITGQHLSVNGGVHLSS